jgi:uncharacterized coiled-coil protein SlyX
MRALALALLLAGCSNSPDARFDRLQQQVAEQQKVIDQLVAAQASQIEFNANTLTNMHELQRAGCSQLQINDRLLGTHEAVPCQ